LTDGNWKTGSTVVTVGENPSAKDYLPEVDPLLTKMPLKYYAISIFNRSKYINFQLKIALFPALSLHPTTNFPSIRF
jgi:hypothetical protein